MRKTILLTIASLAFLFSFGQVELSVFEEYRPVKSSDQCSKDVKTGLVFNTSSDLFEILKRENHAKLGIIFPEGEAKTLVISKRSFDASDFTIQLKSKEGSRIYSNTLNGYHFGGMVEGIKNSVVFLSVFDGELSAVISIPGKGNYNLGLLKEPTADGLNSVFYAEDDVFNAPLSACGVTPDMMKGQDVTFDIRESSKNRASCRVVRLYAEFDYYTLDNRFNGNLNSTINYGEFLLNMVTGLYELEEIRVKVSEMVIWETDDGYPFETAGEALRDFSYQMQNDFNGDIAALISTRRQGNGGLAWLNVLCQSYNPNWDYGPTSYSNATTRVNQIPAYSWDAQVVTHEIGHNLGSPHTHDCFWNGDFTPIDDCAGTYDQSLRGNCDVAPLPSDGTIMSYCHLVGGVGISFIEGFGPQPRQYMQDRIEAVPCLIEESLVETEMSVPTERLCLGDSATLSLDPGYRYQWSTGDTDPEIVVSSSGTYRVTVYDQNDCSEIFQSDVLFFRGPRNELVYADTTACEGDSILISTEDALDPNQWSWQDSTTEAVYVSRVSENIKLIITDSLGCSTELSLQTFFRPLPDLNLVVLDSSGICPEEIAQVIVEGGDSILLIPNELSYSDSIYQLEAGSYFVWTETDGCFMQDSFSIIGHSRPTASLMESYWICPGDSIEIYTLEDENMDWSYIWNGSDTSFQYLASVEGDVELRIINENNCDTSISSSISIVEVPNIRSIEYEYIDGNSYYTISVDHNMSSHPINYQWTVDGGIILESRGNAIDIEWTTEEDSSWVCLILEVEGELICETEEICLKVPTEVMTNNQEVLYNPLNVEVYPNPFSSYFGLDITALEPGELNIRVLNILGRTVVEEKLRLNALEMSHSISTKNWSSGSYILEVEINNREQRRIKVVKQ